jgi:hypothetical protein
MHAPFNFNCLLNMYDSLFDFSFMLSMYGWFDFSYVLKHSNVIESSH